MDQAGVSWGGGGLGGLGALVWDRESGVQRTWNNSCTFTTIFFSSMTQHLLGLWGWDSSRDKGFSRAKRDSFTRLGKGLAVALMLFQALAGSGGWLQFDASLGSGGPFCHATRYIALRKAKAVWLPYMFIRGPGAVQHLLRSKGAQFRLKVCPSADIFAITHIHSVYFSAMSLFDLVGRRSNLFILAEPISSRATCEVLRCGPRAQIGYRPGGMTSSDLKQTI